MNRLVLVLLVIPLLIVMAARDPEGTGHVAAAIFTVGAKLLDGVADFLSSLVGGSGH